MAVNAGDRLARLVLRYPRKQRWTRLADLQPNSVDAETWRQATSLLRSGPLVSQTLDDGCVVVANEGSGAGHAGEGAGALGVLHKDQDLIYLDDRATWTSEVHEKLMGELTSPLAKAAGPDEVDRGALEEFHRMAAVMRSSSAFDDITGNPIGEWIGVQDEENGQLVFFRQKSLLDLPRGEAFQDITVTFCFGTHKIEVRRFRQTLNIPEFPTEARSREDLVDVLSRASKLMICQGDGFSHPHYAMKKAETFGEMPTTCQVRLHELTCGQRIVVGGGFTGNTVSRAVEVGVNPTTGESAHLVRSRHCQLAFDPVSKRARRCVACQKMLKKLSVDEKSLQETVTSQRVSKFTPVNSMSRQELKLRVLELSGEKKVMQRKRPKLGASNADMMIPTPTADDIDSGKDDHHLGHDAHSHHVPALHTHHGHVHPPHSQHSQQQPHPSSHRQSQSQQQQSPPPQLHHQHAHAMAPHMSHSHHLGHTHEHLPHAEHAPPISSQQLTRYASHQHVDMAVQQQQQQQQPHNLAVNADGSRSSVDSPQLDHPGSLAPSAQQSQHQRQQMRGQHHPHNHY